MTNTQALKNWIKAREAVGQHEAPEWDQLIELAMEKQGVSLRGLARLMGFSPTYVSQVRTGKAVPSEAFAKKLGEVI